MFLLEELNQLRAAFAVESFDLEVAVVDGVGQVGSGALSLTAADGAVVEDGDLLAGAAEEVGRRHPGNACADNAHVYM